MASTDPRSLSLRQLKAVLLVGEVGSVTRASSALARSQSATTKAVTQVERNLGVSLFDRTGSGMLPTAHGRILLRRLRSVAREFELARSAHRSMAGNPDRDSNLPLFRMDISNSRLDALVALYECRDAKRAADSLGVTAQSIYRSLHELQEQLGIALYQRTTAGILEATPFCRTLMTHVKLAYAEIGHAIAELESIGGAPRGRVRIGTLPPTKTIIPQAINRVLSNHPQIQLSVRDGDFPGLESALRSGDLDMVVGTRHVQSDYPDVMFLPLMDAPFFVFAREGHPLADVETVTPAQLSKCQWITPPAHTPQRKWLDSFLDGEGQTLPADSIDCTTFEVISAVVASSDRLGLAPLLDLERSDQRTPVVLLPVPELIDPDPETVPSTLHVMIRAHTTLSPAAKAFYRSLTRVAREIEARLTRGVSLARFSPARILSMDRR
ncbi:MAG: LysR family transcriptional regulator [Proteobacteria bacterium]|nr:LysR family transcriptional regulator [Pseudomonadota bacterium]